ncbi:TonB-dependent receptor [Asticcacaulis solisilvae]|uniref:TonB-dependent receptor n=1 Tax=Asticcacaulis solisilvae TaxID=1217274 RepID=UPI003FD6FA2A
MSSSTRYARLGLTVAASALALGFAIQASAQTAPAAPDDTNVVIVTGVKASLTKSLAIKRKSTQVVDSIVATDIGKLPDNNVVEALQRVPGVQVTDRAGGEVGTVAIRGMSDISSTWNGRTIFTASGRYEALQDIPSTLVRQIDVYKTRDASQNEAGIAGAINVMSLRPFDFKGPEVSFAARDTYLDPAKKWNPQISALVSDRWNTNIGEIGALVNLSYKKDDYRNESVTPGALVPFTTENPMPGYTPLERIFSGWVAGQNEGLPEAAGSKLDFLGTGTAYPYYLSRDAIFQSDLLGERKRTSGNVALQWKPSDNQVYTFEAMYNGYRNTTFNNLLFSFVDWWGNLGSNPASTFTLYPGTDIMKTRTVGAVYGFNSGDLTTNATDSYVYALNGDWHIGDKLHLIGDLSYQTSAFHSEFTAQRIDRVANQINVNFNCKDGIACFSFDDNSLLTQASTWNVAQFYDNANRNKGSAATGSLDGTYDADWGAVHKLSFGVRYDDRKSSEMSRSQSSFLGRNLSTMDAGMQFVTSGFWSGISDVPHTWMEANGYWMRDHIDDIRTLYHSVDSTFKTTNQLSMHKAFDVEEKNASAYLMADSENEVFGHKLRGNFGVRYVSVDTFITSYRWNNQTQAIDDTEHYKQTIGKLLPSVTLRYDLSNQFDMRFNYGETLRRPDFGAIGGALNPTDDITAVGYGGGSIGNPNLKATTSKNTDLTAEWYFSNDSAIYATAFDRSIDGFIVYLPHMIHEDPAHDPFPNSTTGKSHANGYDYNVSTPYNASNGKMDGLELGTIWFPKGLPGILDGLGFNGSATFLQTSQDIPNVDANGNIVSYSKTAFYGVSRYSYNATLAYEKGPISARLSYVWRSKFLDRNEAALFANPIGVYRREEKDIDFQLTYALNNRMSFDIDAVNITNEKQQEYYHFGSAGTQDTTNFGTVLIGRAVSVGFRYKM